MLDFILGIVEAVVTFGFVALSLVLVAGLMMIVFSLAFYMDRKVRRD